MIRVVVLLTAKPGRRDELLAAFKANVPAVLREKGCVEYAAYLDQEGGGPFQTKVGPDSFMILETWETLADLEAHRTAPHMVAYGKTAKDLIASRAIHVLTAA